MLEIQRLIREIERLLFQEHILKVCGLDQPSAQAPRLLRRVGAWLLPDIIIIIMLFNDLKFIRRIEESGREVACKVRHLERRVDGSRGVAVVLTPTIGEG